MAEAKPRTTDVLIAGGGLAGLLLARELRRRGRRVVVADAHPAPRGAWSAAVGLLNPVRGQRFTLAWRAQEAFGVAREVYGWLCRGQAGDDAFVRDLPLLRLFANEIERATALARIPTIEAAGFSVRSLVDVPAGLAPARHGGFVVSGAAVAAPERIVAALRGELETAGAWQPRRCHYDDLIVRDGSVTWKSLGLEAGAVVFAGGAADLEFAWAAGLGLRPVQGETLVVRARGLDPSFVLAGRQHLAPRADGRWICGGTKRPDCADATPTPEGRRELEAFLHEQLIVPWEVEEHRAGVRAVSRDRRPIVGALPHVGPGVYVFNGLGAQGVAHGPWLARLLAEHLANGALLPADVSPQRFARLGAVGGNWHAVAIAHAEAGRYLQPGSLAIDLTAGNGGDTCWLAERVGPRGRVLAIDIQAEAVAATRRRLQDAGTAVEERVDLRCVDHARLAEIAGDAFPAGRIAVVMANLGYFPGSASTVVTRPHTTRAALTAAVGLLRPGGALVVVVYSGHPGGGEERDAVERWASTLDVESFGLVWHRGPANGRRAPAVLVVERLEE